MQHTSIGLIGCGNWGRHILRDLVSLGCRVSVVARSPASRALAENGGATTIVAHVDQMGPVEGLVIATPTVTHAEVISTVLDRGVPIFCEKPLCDGLEMARTLTARAGERLFVMDKWRYHPGVRTLGALARSGELGDLVGLRTRRLGWGNPHQDTDCAWHLLPHELAIGLEILGQVPEPRLAVVERDTAGSLFGVTAILGEPVWHVTEVSVRWPEHRRSVELLCTEGTAILSDSYSDHLLLFPNPSRHGAKTPPAGIRRQVGTELPLAEELRAVVAYLRGGTAPKSSAFEAVAVIEAIERIRALAGLTQPSS